MKFDLTYEDMSLLAEGYALKAAAFERGAEACNGKLQSDDRHRRDWTRIACRLRRRSMAWQIAADTSVGVFEPLVELPIDAEVEELPE